MIYSKVLCNYPIAYLQAHLKGICTGDFIVFGATSGSGKSSISRLITRAAFEQQCPVILYSLENSPGTFVSEEVRLLYNQETGSKIEQRPWEIMYTNNSGMYETYCQQIFEKHQKTNSNGIKLLQFYETVAGLNFSVDKLIRSMDKKHKEGYELFVVDHLDMLITDAKNELNQTVYNMNKLWEFVSNNNIALVSFSQMTDLPETILCPNENYLRGSRTKSQKATTVITMAQHKYGYYSAGDGTFPTYMRIAKFRQGSTSCGIVYFKNGRYLEEYKDVLCDYSGKLIDGMTVDRFIKDAKK